MTGHAEGGPLRPQAGALHRAGGGMIHLSAILQQAALKGVGIFSNVVGQPHETAARAAVPSRWASTDCSEPSSETWARQRRTGMADTSYGQRNAAKL